MKHLYHIETGQIVLSSNDDVLTPDGPHPCPPGDFAVLTDSVDEQPQEIPQGHTLEAYTEADLESELLRKRWRIVPIRTGPVTKLTIKRRVRPEEWAAIKAAIASDADAMEEWNLATVIEPDNPRTVAMIEALTGAGLVTTPTATIFAQE